MNQRIVQVEAPSRLHFGLLSFGHSGQRQHGGVGVMIDRPGVKLRITAADQLTTTGPGAERAAEFAGRWARLHHAGKNPACQIDIVQAAPPHCGLGSGTQLALSVAAGLDAFFFETRRSPAELAAATGRGMRSAVGTYGFALGGLVAEYGRLPQEQFAPLWQRVPLPAAWRFVLIRPTAQDIGPSGMTEQQIFDRLPPVPEKVTRELCEQIEKNLLPAAQAGQFETFAESIYRYGYRAGLCFSAVQGGAYNGPGLEMLVELVRQLGGRGVGQSSWGPTLFVVQPDEPAARDFAGTLTAALQEGPTREPVNISIAGPCNTGARVLLSERGADWTSL